MWLAIWRKSTVPPLLIPTPIYLGVNSGVKSDAGGAIVTCDRLRVRWVTGLRSLDRPLSRTPGGPSAFGSVHIQRSIKYLM
jgi:hypothetical protein